MCMKNVQRHIYLHMKLQFCAEQIGINSYQLPISVMEVALETTRAEKQELSCEIEGKNKYYRKYSKTHP